MVTGTRRQCGTSSGYEVHRYHHEPPCEACRDALNAHLRAKYWETRTPAFTSLDKTLDHIGELRANGLTIKTIAELSGIKTGSLYRIARKHYKTIRVENEKKILAVPIPQIPTPDPEPAPVFEPAPDLILEPAPLTRHELREEVKATRAWLKNHAHISPRNPQYQTVARQARRLHALHTTLESAPT